MALGSKLVPFNQTRSLRDLIVLESNFTEKHFFCSKEMTENNDEKNISRTTQQLEQANTITFITHRFRVSVVSDAEI